ncbi:hypothetical protein [Pseudoalteromonas sp.]|uniref:hypothetical protein n=1 Tax=Pseudoalteromonas sp. TaxID=53249 RepID=UPI0023543725|nr:hypothetical protein [Pseudoalteromonas sp.]
MYVHVDKSKRNVLSPSMHSSNKKQNTKRKPIQRMEGLAGLFGLDQWVPTGAPILTRADFQNLLHGGRIDADQLMGVIPAGLQNTFDIGPRTQRGFKFEWGDWHVHGHEADAGAQAGHVGGAGWVVRIRNGNQWLLSEPLVSVHPDDHLKYFEPRNWASANGQFAREHSHIPLDFG